MYVVMGRVLGLALTDREKDILRLWSEGLSDYKVARKLKLDPGNVTQYRKNALKKLERAKADLKFLEDLEG